MTDEPFTKFFASRWFVAMARLAMFLASALIGYSVLLIQDLHERTAGMDVMRVEMARDRAVTAETVRKLDEASKERVVLRVDIAKIQALLQVMRRESREEDRL
jgi:cell division septal protein FtsQ